MTARWICLAAVLFVAVPSVALAKPTAHHGGSKVSKKKVLHARWRAATSAFRIGPGSLFGGASAPGGSSKPAPGGGPTGGPAPGGGSDPTAPAPVYHTLSVASKEFSFTMSRLLLTPGSETIQLNNRGEDPHNLVIAPEDGSSGPLASYPDVAPDDNHTQQVDLPAGRYKLWCSLPGHEALGMHATLRVE